jgi:PIN domain nuclease of toxin-antitoxin system
VRLLLDTHTVLRWDDDPGRLPAEVLERCQDQENDLLLSVASVWEMQIKLQLGKLSLTLPLSELISGQQRTNALEILPVSLPHVLSVGDLPPHHKDPFDRLLVAQANVEGALLVSADPALRAYPVHLLSFTPGPSRTQS